VYTTASIVAAHHIRHKTKRAKKSNAGEVRKKKGHERWNKPRDRREKRAFKSAVKPFFESTCLIDVETERTALMEHGR
jgi:hypothetical protein